VCNRIVRMPARLPEIYVSAYLGSCLRIYVFALDVF
jgi:hypothetical protein